MAGITELRNIRCPDCGGKLRGNKSGKHFCDNGKCPVIFVQPGRGYKGSDVVVRDAVMANAER